MAFFYNQNGFNDTLDTFKAIAYYRLSKEDQKKDSDKSGESNSISNQRKIVRSYISKSNNIVLVDEKIDDGYSGTNYDRPGFLDVITAIKSGVANCIIVKDLSRLGREYIETGRYLEQIFPEYGVRFIAVNDDVDTHRPKNHDNLIIPFKNIVNENHCSSLSQKLREQFKIQRDNGEYMGSFVSFGYCKSPEDKHKIIIDECAAETVKLIFDLKIKGYSQQAIADYLNDKKCLSPAEYKRSIGLKYKTGFQSTQGSKWSAITVRRILTNPIYKGTLIQGKRGTVNYKVSKMRVRDEKDWSVVENNHEAIIEPLVFSLVQLLLERDTRTPPHEKSVLPFAGLVFCPDCKRAMCRRTVSRNDKKYYYYVCSSYKHGNGCTSHSIEEHKLQSMVINALNYHINLIIELDNLICDIGQKDIMNIRVKRFDAMIFQKEKDKDNWMNYKVKLYEALTDNLIDSEEYEKMRLKYSELIKGAEQAVFELKKQRNEIISSVNTDRKWISQFLQYQGITELTREMAVAVIDRIYIFEDKRIKLDFRYRDEFEDYKEALKQIVKEVG
mgnify:CR=1 FL=1